MMLTELGKKMFIGEKYRKKFGKFWHVCQKCNNKSVSQGYQENCKKCGNAYLVWFVSEEGIPVPSINNKEILIEEK